jgi:AraC family transcriptional regulator, regulatory protein of adaptative response / methylated-DNA-[protein]-cysteine methyltransferase
MPLDCRTVGRLFIESHRQRYGCLPTFFTAKAHYHQGRNWRTLILRIEVPRRQNSHAGNLMQALSVNLNAITPEELKNKGKHIVFTYGFYPTPFGTAFIVKRDRDIYRIEFMDAQNSEDLLNRLKTEWPLATLVKQNDSDNALAQQLFERENTGLSFSVWLKGTDFQLKVWRALLQIPTGEITSYRQIAQTINRPTASRAVGGAIGANPVAWIIPCHRVIQQSGGIGGYRWGIARKKDMLAWEGINV